MNSTALVLFAILAVSAAGPFTPGFHGYVSRTVYNGYDQPETHVVEYVMPQEAATLHTFNNNMPAVVPRTNLRKKRQIGMGGGMAGAQAQAQSQAMGGSMMGGYPYGMGFPMMGGFPFIG